MGDTSFEITFSDGTVERIDGVDGYTPEGPLTTFFASDRGRLDSWAVRVASLRTDTIAAIRRDGDTASAGPRPMVRLHTA